jgi:RNA polymerase primary sigma factor
MRDFKITQRLGNSSPNLSLYFSEIRKEKILSPEEEAELAYRGDREAKEKIVKANLRFVVSVAKAYSSPAVPLEDLISEGNKGLLEAIEKFQPETGFKFISYAVWHIRKNIFYYISQHGRHIRVPSNLLQELSKYQKIEESFITSNGRNPSHEEIFDLMEKISERGKGFSSRFIRFVKTQTETVPLESPSAEGGKDDTDFGPINWVESGENTDSLALSSDGEKEIETLMGRLTETQKELVKMKYGIGEYRREMSLTQIAEHFGRSVEWARWNLRRSEKIMRATSKRIS